MKAAAQEALRANESHLQTLIAMAFYDPLHAIRFDPKLGLVVTPDPNIIQRVSMARVPTSVSIMPMEYVTWHGNPNATLMRES